ncbi:uncharacterized protein LOC122093027 [Macadamia integrifolia]|uniref:uncharacterized protein LOC122093027 n=1 Tax=Macadamia integrifolia TaxID=60698 RepID=UPI001C52FA9A|nr:uncharacterized protein LOC122093027 [Macadamia integrifolia]
MSVIQYPDAINAPELQIWNNAAFDSGDKDESAAMNASWCSLQSISISCSESHESDSSKENFSPDFCKSNVSLKFSTPLKPLQQNDATGRTEGKPLKLLFKQGILLPSPTKPPSKTENEGPRDHSNIDTEIEEIEMEISRLRSKLEALRLEKAEKNLKTTERRQGIVHARFVEEKQSSRKSATGIKIEEPPATNTGTKFRCRGVSLGPAEIIAGISSRHTGKLEITPIQSIQNRRKSCFWKLEDIKEEVTKQRRRSVSSSPKSRLSVSKIQASKQALTTVGSKKFMKRDDSFMSSIQPQKLFKEGEKSVASKKPLRPGRVIASRYNETPVKSTGNPPKTDQRKRSLPENDRVDNKRYDKKRFSVGKFQGFQSEPGRNQVSEKKVKKRWEIPSEAAIDLKNSFVNESQLSVLKVADVLPRIKTVRCTDESPRDSGPAKRVAELIGRKSYFSVEETEVEVPTSFSNVNHGSPCDGLSIYGAGFDSCGPRMGLHMKNHGKFGGNWVLLTLIDGFLYTE